MYSITNTDRYGDGDIPEIDINPYLNHRFEPEIQSNSQNHMGSEPLPESTRERRDGPGGE